MTIKIVGLVGETESGKDTIADFAINHFGARRIAFADPIRNCALAIDPIVPVVVVDDINGGEDRVQLARVSDIVTRIGWREAKKMPEVRRLLQRIGTEMGREIIHDDLWINLGFRLLMAYHSGSGGEIQNFVITDVRFPNEAVKSQDFATQLEAEFKLIRVKRPGYGPVNDHASENSYDEIEPISGVINNDGTLEDLEATAKTVLGRIFN